MSMAELSSCDKISNFLCTVTSSTLPNSDPIRIESSLGVGVTNGRASIV